MTPVTMPKANENLTEATLDRWLVKPGDKVAEHQPLCEIITDKAKFELPSPTAGTVLKLYTLERAMLPVGYTLCVLGQSEEAPPIEIEPQNAALLQAHRGAVTASAPNSGAAAGAAILSGGSAVRATPAARRVAKELGVDLAAVAAALKLSAPVNEKDVREFAQKKADRHQMNN